MLVARKSPLQPSHKWAHASALARMTGNGPLFLREHIPNWNHRINPIINLDERREIILQAAYARFPKLPWHWVVDEYLQPLLKLKQPLLGLALEES